MSRSMTFRRTHGTLGWLLLCMSVLTNGCGGPPQVGLSNHRLVHGLRTAVSARRTDWLDSSAQLAAERHAEGELNDAAFAAIESIVAKARDGQWEDAQSEVLALAKAQQATPDEIKASKAQRTKP